MFTRRILAIAMAVLLVGLPTAAAAAQPQSVIGSISGSIDTKNLKAADYTIRLRDVMGGQVIQTGTLTPTGQFTFAQLPLGRTYMVELVDKASNKVVGTQGPFMLSTATSVVKSGVIVSTASSKSTMLWLLAAGAGTAATVSAATASGSR
jgi:hypothetical protein